MTGLIARVLGAAGPAWDAVLAGHPHDIYHTAGYHRVAEAAGEGAARLVIAGTSERGLAWPSLLRPVPGALTVERRDATDVSSVYGYPGPVAWGCVPGDSFLTDAWRAIVAAWRDMGAVSAFTRFHPILRNADLVSGIELDDGVIGAVLPGGQTVSIDATLDDVTIRARYAPNLRREIDAARRAGMTSEPDPDWAALDAFVRLYSDTMVRSEAASSYFLDGTDFVRLRDALGDRLHLLVTTIDGDVAAAGLFTELGGIVQTHLVGTNAALLHHSPYKVLVDDARMWARERRNRVLHLGGGRGGKEDSLYWFKSRFSADRHPFHTGRWILDESAYRSLAPSAPAAVDDGFFPAYRAKAHSPIEPFAERS